MEGPGERRIRLTVVSMIRASSPLRCLQVESYEEWFKFHPDNLAPVLSYLVTSLTVSGSISRAAADALKAICDICRGRLVQHISAVSQLHGRIGDLEVGHYARCLKLTFQVEEQTKVIQAITSVIQALAPSDAIGPIEVGHNDVPI